MTGDKDIVFFDPAAAPEELWTAHYDHLDAISRELDPDEPLLPRAKSREMLLASLEVRYVATSNAGSNAPMMAINKALGFKKRRPVLIYKLRLNGASSGGI
jgi:hypothetical protein